MRDSARTCCAAPIRTASRGMPKTTHVSSFWAAVAAPASRKPQKAGGAVGAHARQHRGHGVRAGPRLHGRVKHDIHRRPLMMDGRAVV